MEAQRPSCFTSTTFQGPARSVTQASSRVASRLPSASWPTGTHNLKTSSSSSTTSRGLQESSKKRYVVARRDAPFVLRVLEPRMLESVCVAHEEAPKDIHLGRRVRQSAKSACGAKSCTIISQEALRLILPETCASSPSHSGGEGFVAAGDVTKRRRARC